MCDQGAPRKVEFVPELATTDAAQRRRVIASFGALLDGLALNHYFDPVGLTDDEIVRLADEDNENDGYHHHVPITDTWAEYWRLKSSDRSSSGRMVAKSLAGRARVQAS